MLHLVLITVLFFLIPFFVYLLSPESGEKQTCIKKDCTSQPP